MTSCLFSCISNPFCKRIYSKKKEFAPRGVNYFLLEKTSFWKGTKLILTELPPPEMHPLPLNKKCQSAMLKQYPCILMYNPDTITTGPDQNVKMCNAPVICSTGPGNSGALIFHFLKPC